MATLVFLDYKTFCVNDKIIIEFAFRGISRIIEASVSVICLSLKRKCKSKKRQTEESVSEKNNSTMSNPGTLPVNNRLSILNDLDDQEDSLDTNNGKPHGSESNQIKKSNVQTDHNIADEVHD